MNSEVRSKSWQVFKANFWMLILVNFLYTLIAGVPNMVPIVGMILTALLMPVLMMGMVHICLNVCYGGKVDVEDLFTYFKNKMFMKPVGVYWLMFLYLWLWSLLFWIPGLIKSYSYALTPYIWHDNTEISATDAITESRHLMNGNKWRLFCCELPYYLCMLPGTLMYMVSMLPIFIASLRGDDGGYEAGMSVMMSMLGMGVSYIIMYVSILIVTPLLQVVRANFYLDVTKPYREQNGGYGQDFQDSARQMADRFKSFDNFGQNESTGAGYGQSESTGAGYGQSESTGVGYGQSGSTVAGNGQSESAGMSYGQSETSGVGYGQSETSGAGYGQSETSGAGYAQSESAGAGYVNEQSSSGDMSGVSEDMRNSSKTTFGDGIEG